jgi:DNA-directed RNA polymerase specialized sigma24 family protein
VLDVRRSWPGASVAQIADTIGMTYGALEIALRRARADGEPV